MLIQTNTNIAAIAIYLILVQNFYGEMEAWGGNVIIFWLKNSSFVHIDGENKNILLLGEGPT